MNFKQDAVSADKVQSSLRAMINDGRFRADIVVVDGYDFEKAMPGDIRSFREFARECGIEFWFSASLQENGSVMPELFKKFGEDIAVFIELEACGKYIHLKLIKDHEVFPASDPHLKLDPQILLIAQETGAMPG
jgi:hypothetical protein